MHVHKYTILYHREKAQRDSDFAEILNFQNYL